MSAGWMSCLLHFLSPPDTHHHVLLIVWIKSGFYAERQKDKVEKWGRNGEKCLWKRKQNVKKRQGGFYDIVRVGIYGEVRHMMEYFFYGRI